LQQSGISKALQLWILEKYSSAAVVSELLLCYYISYKPSPCG
jgi:hypothetical protein